MTYVRDSRLGSNVRLDAVGAVMSASCAVHCGLSALVPAVLGAMGLGALVGHEVEWLLTGCAATVAFVAAFYGYRRHRNLWLTVQLTVLAIALVTALMLEETVLGEAAGPLAIVAGLLLVVSHWMNLRARPAEVCPTPSPGEGL